MGRPWILRAGGGQVASNGDGTAGPTSEPSESSPAASAGRRPNRPVSTKRVQPGLQRGHRTPHRDASPSGRAHHDWPPRRPHGRTAQHQPSAAEDLKGDQLRHRSARTPSFGLGDTLRVPTTPLKSAAKPPAPPLTPSPPDPPTSRTRQHGQPPSGRGQRLRPGLPRQRLHAKPRDPSVRCRRR